MNSDFEITHELTGLASLHERTIDVNIFLSSGFYTSLAKVQIIILSPAPECAKKYILVLGQESCATLI